MFGLIRKDTKIFDLFEKAAEVLIRTTEAFADLANDYARKEEHIARIRQYEHDGDETIHRTLDKLDKTFITPFDREDIQTLMKRIDDVIDEIDAAAKRLVLYKITEPTTWFVKQTDVLVRAAKALAQAISKLRNLKKPNGLHEYLVEIHRMENIGDDNNHAALAELFNGVHDPMFVMKWKEIYDLTEKAIDRCEDIANTIEAIVHKNG